MAPLNLCPLWIGTTIPACNYGRWAIKHQTHKTPAYTFSPTPVARFSGLVVHVRTQVLLGGTRVR